MSMNGREIRNELEDLLDQIELQMEEVKQEAGDRGCRPEEMREIDGSFTTMPLILAKAQVLSALSNLRPNIVNHMTTPPSPHRLH